MSESTVKRPLPAASGSAESWWTDHCHLLAEKMKRGGVRLLRIERSKRRSFIFEVVPCGEKSQEETAVDVCERIMDAIAGHTDWHPSMHVDTPDWNEKAHIEVTITIADCRAIKRVLEAAGRLDQYL